MSTLGKEMLCNVSIYCNLFIYLLQLTQFLLLHTNNCFLPYHGEPRAGHNSFTLNSFTKIKYLHYYQSIKKEKEGN